MHIHTVLAIWQNMSSDFMTTCGKTKDIKLQQLHFGFAHKTHLIFIHCLVEIPLFVWDQVEPCCATNCSFEPSAILGVSVPHLAFQHGENPACFECHAAILAEKPQVGCQGLCWHRGKPSIIADQENPRGETRDWWCCSFDWSYSVFSPWRWQ